MKLTIINGTIFDGVSADLAAENIHIVDDEIVRVDDSGPEPDDEVVDARGGTVVPGLVDAHFHAYATSLSQQTIHASPLSYVALVAARRLAAALSRGFTTVRDVAGGDPGLAKAVEDRLIIAPRYLYTGPALSQTGGHGDGRPGDLDLCACHAHMSEVVDGVENVRKAARERLRRGAHAIKVFTSGGVISPTDPIRNPQYSAEEIQAITDEATRRGSYVAAHAYSPEAIAHSVRNGVRSIEHGNLLDESTASLMADHDAFLVPTLAAYDAMERRGEQLGLSAVSQAKNLEVLNAGRNAIKLARAAGVPIGWGSDLMGELEDEQLNGLRAQIEVEGALEGLRSATSVNAALLRRDDLGRIGVGARADLVIFAGNPLDDPSLLWSSTSERTIIRGGHLVSCS